MLGATLANLTETVLYSLLASVALRTAFAEKSDGRALLYRQHRLCALFYVLLGGCNLLTHR